MIHESSIRNEYNLKNKKEEMSSPIINTLDLEVNGITINNTLEGSLDN